MKSIEQSPEKRDFSEEQTQHPPGTLTLSEAARTDWLHLSKCLITAYQQCLTCMQPHLEEATRDKASQAAVESALQGNAAALALIGVSAEGVNRQALHHESPWIEIGRAYAAAFTAAGFVALQASGTSVRMATLSAELARLALRAAETLAHGVGLLLGTRKSGSIAQISAYVGTLEGQADTLLRGFLASPSGGKRNGGQRDDAAQYSADRQTLLALEAMTDRCEDIADALLAAAHDCYEGQSAACHPPLAMPGSGETHAP
jgi:hypothetical protein